MADEENQDENATTELAAQTAPVSVPLPVSHATDVLPDEAVLTPPPPRHSGATPPPEGTTIDAANPPLVIPAEDMPSASEKSVNVIETTPLEANAPAPEETPLAESVDAPQTVNTPVYRPLDDTTPSSASVSTAVATSADRQEGALPHNSPPMEGRGVGTGQEEEEKVIEKIVERVVEKPVEVIKEIIKEVPVERIVEVEKIVEKPVEVIKEIKVFDEARARAEEKSRLIGSRTAALNARQRKRDEKLEKVVQFVREHGRVTNDEAQILLGISNRSATRYLSILAKAGRLRKVNRGHWAHYESM